MWVHEMEAVEKTAYGFVKLTKDDFEKLGIYRKTNPAPKEIFHLKCEACGENQVRYLRVKLNAKNNSSNKSAANLCADCEENNSRGRSIIRGWLE